jgi:hypothetical protein
MRCHELLFQSRFEGLSCQMRSLSVLKKGLIK